MTPCKIGLVLRTFGISIVSNIFLAFLFELDNDCFVDEMISGSFGMGLK